MQTWTVNLDDKTHKQLCEKLGMQFKHLCIDDYTWDGLEEVFAYFSELFSRLNTLCGTNITCVDVLNPKATKNMICPVIRAATSDIDRVALVTGIILSH